MERNEAIEIVKKNYPHVATSGSQFETALRELVPDLVCEDEQTRRELIEVINNSYDLGGFKLNSEDLRRKYIAWLEKQKDSQSIILSEKNIADVFEKVGLAKIVREQADDELTNALQDAMLELSKVGNAEWSEEDEDNLHNIKLIIENFNSTIPYSGGNLTPSKEYKQELISWLKSLRPQPHWKPSEEKMCAFKLAMIPMRDKHNASVSGIPAYDTLCSLYYDLKSL